MGIPKRRTRAEQNADNRQRLIDAAREVFLAAGYHGATLDKVAEAAALTKGAVYSRFASKADLFLALYEEHVAQRIAEIAATPRGVDAADAFVGWLDRSRKHGDWSLLIIEFRVAAARDPALNARYSAIHDRLIRAAADVLEREAAAGATFTAPALELARVTLAFGTGLLLERAAVGPFPTELAGRAGRAIHDAAIRPRPRRIR